MFLLLSLFPGSDLFISSLRLWLPSWLTSTLASTKLYVKFKNLGKLLVALKWLCTLKIFTKPFAQSQNKLDWWKTIAINSINDAV